MPFVDLIAGARPNFVKIAAIIRALESRPAHERRLGYRLVHTGQHYDRKLSGDFFNELGIPEPAINLQVGSGTQATQTAAIMTRYEELLLREAPAATLVVGDVTSTMACAITAQKLGVPVAHVEAGIRSGDWSMPEEINRLVTDAITNWFFTTSEYANAELRRCGVAQERIFFVGNTMIDTLLAYRGRFHRPYGFEDIDLADRSYLVLTLHRPNNVDHPNRLRALLCAVAEGADGLPVIFPIHPRTRRTLMESEMTLPSIFRPCDPLSYLEFNYLVDHALGVVTDSGGITEETTILGVPCVTLRNSTERPETVTLGTNELLGTNPSAIAPALLRMRDGTWKKGSVPPLWDGQAGERIVAKLESILIDHFDENQNFFINCEDRTGANDSIAMISIARGMARR